MKPPVLEFKGASVASTQEASAVVTGIDWRVEDGDSWIIGGLQGSGKTAVLETAMGLRSLLSGSLRLFGENLDDLTQKEARELRLRVGMLFEGAGRLFAELTVLENLLLPLRYHHNLGFTEGIQAIQPLMECLDLASVAGRHPGKIGYGVAKRVALARALVLRPEILLADDPLGGLDSAQARSMRRHLLQLSKGHSWYDGRPITLIITAEELRTFVSSTNQFAIVDRHGWKTVGTRDQLLSDPTEAVQELLTEHLDPAIS